MLLDQIFLALFVLFVIYQVVHSFKWKAIDPQFNGKTIFITGASSGIGEELSYQFVAAGAKKLILAARRIPELERVKKACFKISQKTEIEILQLDLAEPEKCLEVAESISCDILINNGGLSQRDPFVDCDFSMAKYMMNVNCMGPIALIKGIVSKYMETFNSSKQL
jgi:short-subunit dehydrogenase